MKKILSIVLAVALCLTAMVGCFTVSAAGAATATVGTVSVDAGTAEAVVNITIAGDAIAATYIDVALADELVLAGVASATEGLNAMHNSVNAEGVEDFSVANAAHAIRILLDSAEGIVDYTELKVALTFNTADMVAGEYAVTVTGSDAADSSETAVVVSPVAGAVVVNEVSTEPVLDESVVPTFSCGLGDTVYISCVISKSLISDYAGFDVVVTRNTTSGSDYNFAEIVTTIPADKIIETNTSYYCYYYGVELYSLMIPCKFVINLKDAEGNVVAYSNTYTTTLKDALAVNYAKTSNLKLKATITDLINAGTVVQQYFTKGKTCDYANLALPNADWDQTYATAELGELASYNTANNGDIILAPGGGVSAAPYVSFNMSGIVADELDQYTIKFSYYNANYKKTMSTTIPLTDSSVLASGGKYYAYYRELAIYATNAEITAELYKAGSDAPISTYSYCFDTFITSRLNNAKLGDVVKALGILGQSFRTLKGI